MGPHKHILFVDYENAGKVDLSAIPADVFVPFFIAASQKKVATDFALAMHTLGARFFPVKLEGQPGRLTVLDGMPRKTCARPTVPMHGYASIAATSGTPPELERIEPR